MLAFDLCLQPELPSQEKVNYTGTAHPRSGRSRVGATNSSISLLGANEADSAMTAVPLRAAHGTQTISGRMQQVYGASHYSVMHVSTTC